MRYLNEISIEDLIIHIVDNKNSNLILSDFPIDISNNQKILEYFNDHVTRSLNDNSSKAAKFTHIHDDEVSGICRDILLNETTFISNSKIIAQKLFDIVNKDMRISPSDLAICIYCDTNNPKNKYLAIMKINPSEVFQHKIEITQDNKTKIDFELTNEAFTKEKLQKCAFIRELSPRDEDFDMILLDKQSGLSRDGDIAKFFAEDFLKIVYAFDSKRRTEDLHKYALLAINRVRHKLTPEKAQDLDNRLNLALTGKKIHLLDWVENLPVDDEIQMEMKELLQENIPDVEFNIDQQVSERLLSRVTYKADYNTRLSIPESHYNDIVISANRKESPGGEYYEVILHTRMWKRTQ